MTRSVSERRGTNGATLVQHPLVLHSLGKEKGEMVEKEEDGSAVEVDFVPEHQ